MNRFDDEQRSAIGPSTGRQATIEIGMVQSVDRKNGTCEVVTELGREVQVHIGTPMAGISGTGVKVTPRINAKCLVVLFVSGQTGMVRSEDGYLISTFQAEEGDTEEWGAPGDFHLTTDGGGELLMSQSGVINHQADPWARQAFLPKEKTIKQWCKNHERLHTPLAHNKTIHDDEAEVAFNEFALNSRFLHRENDNRPVRVAARQRGSIAATRLVEDVLRQEERK